MSAERNEFDEIAHQIRVLSTILQKMKRGSDATRHPENVPKILSHVVTLLTCGDNLNGSASAPEVVAATGSLQPGSGGILVVTQNAGSKSPVSQLRVEELHKGKSFEDAVSGNPDASTLQEHITDIWAALAGYDPATPAADDNFNSFVQFVVSRSFRKIQVRFNEDRCMFRRDRLFDIIRQWAPRPSDNFSERWIAVPDWLLSAFDPAPTIESKEIEGVLHWKLSTDTLKLWAMILVNLLESLGEHIDEASASRGEGMLTRGPSEEEREAIANVNYYCYLLYLFVKWDKHVVQILLEETSLGSWLARSMISHDRPGENEDWDLYQSVLRYLRTLTAWHAALEYLCFNPYLRQTAANLIVGFVEVPSSAQVSTREKFVGTYFDRYPTEGGDEDVVATIKRYHPTIQTFGGTIHAEATLMGLLAYTRWNQTFNYGEVIHNQELLSRILERAEDAVVVGKKCCWCCAKLAGLLGKRLNVEFKIPGTHGLIYAWSPPTVGIHVDVLRELEGELWAELHSAIADARTASLHSRQSSGSSTDAPEHPLGVSNTVTGPGKYH